MIEEVEARFRASAMRAALSIKHSPCNKDNDDREDRCTFRIAQETDLWPTAPVRYDREYSNARHDMPGSQHHPHDHGVSSGRIHD